MVIYVSNRHNAHMQIFTLHFDGSCGPKNPGGTAAYGFTLDKGAERITDGHSVIGTGPTMTNNVAEYAGLYEGLAAFAEHIAPMVDGRRFMLNVRGDSQLVIKQMSGQWGAKAGHYYENYRMTKGLVKTLRQKGVQFSFEWIPREFNQVCDDLSKAHEKV